MHRTTISTKRLVKCLRRIRRLVPSVRIQPILADEYVLQFSEGYFLAHDFLQQGA